jgi:hypothetical protein
MARILEQLSRIAAWLSQGANCILLGGHHDCTVSARCYLQREQAGWSLAYRVVNALFFWQADHCYESFQRDVEWAKQVIARAEI